MNKYFLKTLIASLGVIFLFLGSCKKNNVVVDQNIVPPTYVKFNVRSATDTAATYFVKSTGETFKLPVGITTVSDKDRTVNFTYTSTTAVQGVQYNAPTSITIHAGDALDSLEITGLFAGIGVGEVDTLKIQITATDEVPISPYKNYYFIYLRKSCPINILDFEGNFDNTLDNPGPSQYGPYTATLTPGSIIMNTPTNATFTLENVWDPGLPVIMTVTADWTADADHPTIDIPDQAYIVIPGTYNYWIIGTGAGTFSACDGTITLHYTLYDKDTGAPLSANQETVMTR